MSDAGIHAAAAIVALRLLIVEGASGTGSFEKAGRRDLPSVRDWLHQFGTIDGLRILPCAGDVLEELQWFPARSVQRSRLLLQQLSAEEGLHVGLTKLYETALRYRVESREGTTLLRREVVARRASGAYYTPPEVARVVVQAGLEALSTRQLHPHVLDPAMGTGVFLFETLQALQDIHGIPPARLAEECLWGIDRDPIAVEIALISLAIKSGARPSVLAEKLLVADALDSPLFDEKRFDLVAGNPPWGAGHRRSSRGGPDAAKQFLALGVQLSRGAIAMIVPRALLFQEQHEDIRCLLLAGFAPHVLVSISAATFPDAIAPACALVFGRRPGPEMVRTLHYPSPDSADASASPSNAVSVAATSAGLQSPSTESPAATLMPARLWTGEGGFPDRNAELLNALRDLGRNFPTLGDLGHLYRIRDTGINYNRAAVSARVFYQGEKAMPCDIPRYRGRNFSRYTGISIDGWLRANARALLGPGDQLSLDTSTFARAEKIVLRQTADRPIATLDATRMAFGRSVISITREGSCSLLGLLAILNSSVLAALYRALTGEDGRVLPQMKVRKLAALPIPDPEDGSHARVWERLEVLAQQLLDRESDLPDVEAETDSLVLGLYGIRGTVC